MDRQKDILCNYSEINDTVLLKLNQIADEWNTIDAAPKKTDSIQKWSTLYGKDYQDAYHKGL